MSNSGMREVLKKWGAEEVSAMEVYSDVFRLGEHYIQADGEASGQFKSNPIAYWKNNDEDAGHFRIMFEDTFQDTLKELQRADFAILNGLSYFGRKNLQEHASKMYTMIFDLDGVNGVKLNNFLNGAFEVDAYPVPNYIVLSGHGLHLYYVFEEPVSLFPNTKLQLKELKYALTEKIWNEYTSKQKKKQFQGINQGFRVIGGKTKPDADEPKTIAYRLNLHPFSLDQFNKYVPAEHRIDEKKLFRESKITLAEAKIKYPEWYQKVILNKDKSKSLWDISSKVNGDNPYALYDWWKRKIETGATFHHRYFNIMCLAIYAAKCNVPFEQLEADAYGMIPFLNGINPDEPFTKDDVDVALECYDRRYCTFPIKDIVKLSGIEIEKNKRNGRKQNQHVAVMRAIQNVVNPNWRDGNGRKPKNQVVKEWREANPDGKPKDCIKATGLSKNTVYKWW